jgi:hypothetical protein
VLGRAWVCALLIATLTGCASRSRPKPFLPSMSIPPECTTSIRLVGCDLSFSPPRCRTVAVSFRKGCEQVVVGK